MAIWPFYNQIIFALNMDLGSLTDVTVVTSLCWSMRCFAERLQALLCEVSTLSASIHLL